MKRLLLATCAVAAFSLPTIASAAECDTSLSAYDKEMTAEARAQVNPTARRDLRELRDAAYMLKQYGQSEACEEVISAIREISSDPKSMANATNAAAMTDKAAADQSYDERTRMRAEKATPLTQASRTLVASELIGADLHNNAGEDLGSVDDLIVAEKGKMSYLIVNTGGFIGIGEKQIAVPFDAAKISEDGDTVYINATDESLEKAPSFDRDDRGWLSDADWQTKNNKFYHDLK